MLGGGGFWLGSVSKTSDDPNPQTLIKCELRESTQLRFPSWEMSSVLVSRSLSPSI